MTLPFLFAAAQAMTFTADRIAADGVTRALTATGHVVAVSAPFTVRGDLLTRDADGTMLFHDPMCATSCSNEVGHTHWSVTGEVEYKEKEYVILRNAWLRLYEIPVFWLPYMYYPTGWDCGFSWMPGYTGRWAGYLLTKYNYHVLGDPEHGADTYWLSAATRFDLRYRQGIALGEDLKWNLGDFGHGDANVYYAWDQEAEEYYGHETHAYTDSHHSLNWESPVKTERYMVGLNHFIEPTERDTVRLTASVVSDSSFKSDFQRTTMFGWQGPWMGYENSGLFWEHVENAVAVGAEVSGRLNEFYGMTDRLPEVYVDVNPLPVFGLPVNYETENRIGYLRRNPAEYGRSDSSNPFSFVPGLWAAYDAFRFDTYHRLTAPFRAFDDLLSVVPRAGYHGTYWDKGGEDCLTGWERSEEAGHVFRSIFEGGVTFAGRGYGLVDDNWRHMVEPYLDVLAQKAWYDGSARPYVFDSIDASIMWEDQFAGRARNLPYTYCGVTPGLRNAWEKADARGRFREIVDLDVYAAAQFNSADYVGDDDAHKLAEVGSPNYGKNGGFIMPGARVRWKPDKDLSFLSRAEYDSDNNRIAAADAGWRQKVSKDLSYNVKYALRDFRWWDFSSTPYDKKRVVSEDRNYARMHFIQGGFENQPLDWFAWGPYVRWDIRENELDSVGSWFDYLTDCLGFRFMVNYRNSYTMIDRHEYEEDWSFGFFIYLRAFGVESGNPLSSWQ